MNCIINKKKPRTNRFFFLSVIYRLSVINVFKEDRALKFQNHLVLMYMIEIYIVICMNSY